MRQRKSFGASIPIWNYEWKRWDWLRQTRIGRSWSSVKDEWSFVVGNLGEKQGVKIGMPMRVMRGDQRIATLRVVDVRHKICGAVIQEMDAEKEKIKVGDRLQVDAHPDVSLR